MKFKFQYDVPPVGREVEGTLVAQSLGSYQSVSIVAVLEGSYLEIISMEMEPDAKYDSVDQVNYYATSAKLLLGLRDRALYAMGLPTGDPDYDNDDTEGEPYDPEVDKVMDDYSALAVEILVQLANPGSA